MRRAHSRLVGSVRDAHVDPTAPVVVAAVFAARPYTPRSQARHASAGDRTRNEAIADRQSKFQWHDRHVFRPHKVFTYDPCDWNRRLEAAAAKKRGALKIAERLRNLEERAEERQTQLRQRIPSTSSAPIGGDNTVAAASHDAQVEAAVATLTKLLDELPRLRRGVVSARMGGSSRTTLEHQRRLDAYRTALAEAWDKVCEHGAAMVTDAPGTCAPPQQPSSTDPRRDTSTPPRMMTYEALVVCWCELLQGADVVVGILKRAHTGERHQLVDEEDRATRAAIALLYAALRDTFLAISDDARAVLRVDEANAASRVEVLIEELYVLTHPLVDRAPQMLSAAAPEAEGPPETSLVNNCIAASLSTGIADVTAALRQRIAAVDAGDVDVEDASAHGGGLSSVIHPSQLARLCRTLKRLDGRHDSTFVDLLAKLKSLRNVLLLRELRVLCMVASSNLTERQGSVEAVHRQLQPLGRQRGHRRAPLTPSTPSNDVPTATTLQQSIGFSATPTGGTQTPPVDDDEVHDIIEAFTTSLECAHLGGGSAPLRSETTDMAKALLSLLDLMEVTPNYDLDPSNVVALLRAIASSGILDRARTLEVAAVHIRRQSRTHLKSLWSTCEDDGARSLLLRHQCLVIASRLRLQPGMPTGQGHPLAALLWTLLDMRLEDVARSSSQERSDHETQSVNGSLERVVRECKRLRGLVLHTLLNEAMDATTILSCGALFTSDEEYEEGVALLLLHLVAADVPLRMRTWRSIAQCALGSGASNGAGSSGIALRRADVATLLIALRTHVRLPQQQGPGKGPLDKACISVDEADGRLLAALAHCATEQRQGAAATTRSSCNSSGPASGFNPFAPHANRTEVAQRWQEAVEHSFAAHLTDIAAHPAAPGVNDVVVVERLRGLVVSLCGLA